ncbi:MAG: CRISPR-associated helicase/endonuclease Cas3 [Oceanospirillaceae bacterium]|nr:CRISPR-associated helicase/endonuclease Cas3 [Oceanospirillaceae bacterium]
MSQGYFGYWGKAYKQKDQGGDDYHLLPYHCLDVAAVGWQLMSDTYPWASELACKLKTDTQQLRRLFTFFLALHDIGKFARSFQGVAPNLDDSLVPALDGMPYIGARHDSLGYWLWLRSEYFQQAAARVLEVEPGKVKRLTHLDIWFQVVTGHHGQPPKQAESLMHRFTPEDEQAAAEFLLDVAELFLNSSDKQLLLDRRLRTPLREVSWQLAGLAVLADWIGSNQHCFAFCSQIQPLRKYWESVAFSAAEEALLKTPLSPLSHKPFSSIRQLFPFIEIPTPLQQFAVEQPLADSPQLLILEDVTGAGKTEAAMVLVHRLLAQGRADGLYVGLPTMATANAMYERLSRCYRQLFDEDAKASLVLSHGSRHLSESFSQSLERSFSEQVAILEQKTDRYYAPDEPSASAYCNAWIADSRKKALFANVGVGTIDQVLLAVLPARHQSLRLLGLHGKVLLVDEVHASDPYMTGLLQALLELHARQGGSAILLSATLPGQMKTGLLKAFAKGLETVPPDLSSGAYPLVTHFPDKTGRVEYPVQTRNEVKRRVDVRMLSDERQVREVIQAALDEGKSVCWIRNTVDDARRSYRQCSETLNLELERVHLFHSRFAMVDRLAIERQVLEWFGDRSGPESRRARLLISTQVVEQSLDLDFDLLISDLAPIDLLIQRAGRLHRHTRDEEGNRLSGGEVDRRGSAMMYLHSPAPSTDAGVDWLAQQGGTQAIYGDPGVLWRSARLLQEMGGFRMPNDARHLIESVYDEGSTLVTPQALLEASLEAEGQRSAERSMSTFNRLDLSRGYSLDSNAQGWSEEVNIPTRLSDSTCSVILVVKGETGAWVPYAGRHSHGWDLSAISMREKLWLQAEKNISAILVGELEQLREANPVLKWHKLFPWVDELKAAYDPAQGWIGLE